MTVLAAWVDPSGAYLAADSGLVGGAAVEESRIATEQKIRTVSVELTRSDAVPGDALIAAAGNASAGPLAWYSTPPKAPPGRSPYAAEDETRIHAYEVAFDRWAWRWACELEQAAHDARLVCPAAGPDGSTIVDAAWILGFRGQAWLLTERSARRVRSYTAVGTGGAYALGALAGLERQVRDAVLTPCEALGRAVEIACRYDAYCRGPAQVEVVPSG